MAGSVERWQVRWVSPRTSRITERMLRLSMARERLHWRQETQALVSVLALSDRIEAFTVPGSWFLHLHI